MTRLVLVDRAFKNVTYDSARSCMLENQWYGDMNGKLFRRQEAEFPKRKYWFLYRWQRGTAWRAPAPNVAAGFGLLARPGRKAPAAGKVKQTVGDMLKQRSAAR